MNISNAQVRRLGVGVAAGILIAVITSPEGRFGQPGYAISQAFKPAHFFTSLAVGIVAALLFEGWLNQRHRVGPTVSSARSTFAGLWTQRTVRLGLYVCLLVLALVVFQVVGSYWQGVLVEQIGIYSLLAIGLNVVVGFAGLLDLGYVAFYAIGAYTTAYFTGRLPVSPPVTLNPFYCIPLAIVAAMIAGLILGAPTLRLRGDYLAIVTLGFGEIITILAVNLQSITNGSGGAPGIPPFSLHLFGINYDFGLDNAPYYYLLLVFAVLILMLFSRLENSRVGRAWTALREDEVAAQACGIAPVKYKLMAFAIGASTSGFAGALYASKVEFINPSNFSVSISILVLVLVIFGGMGSLFGSVVGAAVIQTAQYYVRKNNTFDPSDIYIYVGALLIIMMIFRPQGLVPSRRRAREIGMAEEGMGAADALAAPGGSPTP
jgi:branched-chain amino acid transport system permease protein